MSRQPERGERIDSLDVFRGLAIVAVVLIHVTGHFLRVITVDSRLWVATAFTNRALQFAVPAFLLLSALLNLRPLLQGRPAGPWFGRRIRRALWPYVVWSVVFFLIAHWDRLAEATPRLALEKLVEGNAYYHLYFLLLVLQMYVLLPLLAPVFRRRPPFWLTALVTLALQFAVYHANKAWFQVPAPGSLIVWYLPSVALGCWLASRWDGLHETIRRAFLPAVLCGAAAMAVYGPTAMALMRREPLSTLVHQASLAVYAAAAACALLAVAAWPGLGRLVPPLRSLGKRSLEIYIAHPIAILLMDGWLHFPPRLPVPAIMAAYTVACLLFPLALAWLVARLGLSRWVWGVDDPAPAAHNGRAPA